MSIFHLRGIPVLAAVVLAGCSMVAAADLQRAPNEFDRLDASITLIPEDAAFYSSMLRNREQFEAVVGSRAFERLRAMSVVRQSAAILQSPLARLVWGLYISQAAEPGSVRARIQQLDAVRKTPQVQSLAALCADMLSNEVFVYCNTSSIEPVGLPGFVVGFKLSNTDRAALELGKLQLTAAVAAYLHPQLKGRVKFAKIGDYSYLVLSLDGSMVRWEQLPLGRLGWFGIGPACVDKLVAQLAALPLVMAVGLRDDYLLLSIGPSTDALARLGQGKRLVDRPELRPLGRFADRRLRSVHYLGRAGSHKVLAFSFLTDEGSECYVYHWLDCLPPAPLKLAAVLDWADLIDAATPWIDATTQRIVGRCLGVDDYSLPKTVTDQIHTLLAVCKVLHRITAESYMEDGALVLHVLWEIRDVR